MSMVKVKTEELDWAALDWAVAQIEGLEVEFGEPAHQFLWLLCDAGSERWQPSADWSQGGPLIDKHIHLISQDGKGGMYAQCVDEPTHEFGEGSTILIAVCRAIVAAKLGDEVEVPSELLGECK